MICNLVSKYIWVVCPCLLQATRVHFVHWEFTEGLGIGRVRGGMIKDQIGPNYTKIL